MFKQIILVALVFGLLNCTKKADQKESLKRLPFDSQIQYVFQKIEDPTQAAVANDAPVSWEQLLSQDVALQELQETYNQAMYRFFYSWAQSLGEVSEAKYFGELPKDPEKVLKDAGLAPSKDLNVSFEAKPTPDVIAEADGKNLRWDDFISANLAHANLYRKLYTQRMQRLNGIVVRRFLLEAAKKTDTPMEDYVRSKIITTEYNPTPEEVMVFAEKQGIAKTDIDETMMERLQEIVRQRHRDQKIEAHVASELVAGPVAVHFFAPKIAVKAPELDDNIPQWGQSGPEIVYVGHWSCEGCNEVLASFLETKTLWAEKAKGAFIYFFPDSDREARMGAEAALCVQAQNEDAFWSFLTSIMAKGDQDLEQAINEAARNSGVDFEQFRSCFLKREHQQVVDTHLAYAKNMGVTSGPLMILQGQVIEAPVTLSSIEQKLKDLGVEPKAKGLLARIKAFFGLT